MKIITEAAKGHDLNGIESEEVLKQFEMLELKGGIHISLDSNNLNCTNSNCNNKCCAKIDEAKAPHQNHLI